MMSDLSISDMSKNIESKTRAPETADEFLRMVELKALKRKKRKEKENNRRNSEDANMDTIDIEDDDYSEKERSGEVTGTSEKQMPEEMEMEDDGYFEDIEEEIKKNEKKPCGRLPITVKAKIIM